MASVTKRENGRFDVMTVQQTYQAHRVVVAIGKKGNPNKLQRPGEALEHVSDRLIDPQRHEDQDILVVGGGDAAAEVALALSDQNQVYMSYRQSDFNPQRMNETLRGKLQDMMARGDIQIIFESSVDRIEPNRVVLDVPHGTQTLMVDQVFVLIGANLPTRFLEHCGVRFSADPHVDPAALPLIDERYQAVGVEGLYIIGALTGKDLIKPVMNQGTSPMMQVISGTSCPLPS